MVRNYKHRHSLIGERVSGRQSTSHTVEELRSEEKLGEKNCHPSLCIKADFAVMYLRLEVGFVKFT